jgi:hypothetical protein
MGRYMKPGEAPKKPRAAAALAEFKEHKKRK